MIFGDDENEAISTPEEEEIGEGVVEVTEDIAE